MSIRACPQIVKYKYISLSDGMHVRSADSPKAIVSTRGRACSAKLRTPLMYTRESYSSRLLIASDWITGHVCCSQDAYIGAVVSPASRSSVHIPSLTLHTHSVVASEDTRLTDKRFGASVYTHV